VQFDNDDDNGHRGLGGAPNPRLLLLRPLLHLRHLVPRLLLLRPLLHLHPAVRRGLASRSPPFCNAYSKNKRRGTLNRAGKL